MKKPNPKLCATQNSRLYVRQTLTKLKTKKHKPEIKKKKKRNWPVISHQIPSSFIINFLKNLGSVFIASSPV